MMEILRDRVQGEIFDYILLMDVLKGYAKPRNKVSQLLKSGDIIRVKKGLYVFGDRFRKGPVCKETVANLIYGPSYISLEYALGYYGMIPERVEQVTSMTTGKTRDFDTPIGRFSYHYLHQKKYHVGVDFVWINSLDSALIATPEKALSDHVARQTDLETPKDIEVYLTQNMRIEKKVLRQLDRKRLQEISEAYSNPRVEALLLIQRGLHG